MWTQKTLDLWKTIGRLEKIMSSKCNKYLSFSLHPLFCASSRLSLHNSLCVQFLHEVFVDGDGNGDDFQSGRAFLQIYVDTDVTNVTAYDTELSMVPTTSKFPQQRFFLLTPAQFAYL